MDRTSRYARCEPPKRSLTLSKTAANKAKVKETRKPESRMMRQVSSPVRRGAGEKADGPRSQPTRLQRSKVLFLGEVFLSFFAFKEGMLRHPISALGGWPTVSGGFLRQR